MVAAVLSSNREKVLSLRQQDPSMPAIRIAEALNITRERVRQLLNEAGLVMWRCNAAHS